MSRDANQKAVLETTPTIRDRAKVIAASRGITLKQVTTLLMERALADVEAGKIQITRTSGAEIINP